VSKKNHLDSELFKNPDAALKFGRRAILKQAPII